MPKVKRSSYSVAEKLQVLQYAKQYGLRPAGRHFTIDPSMISRWQKQEEELDLVKKKREDELVII